MTFLEIISNKYSDKQFLENSFLFGVLQANGFVENGNGQNLKGSDLTLEIKFSNKLELFGKLLKEFFNS